MAAIATTIRPGVSEIAALAARAVENVSSEALGRILIRAHADPSAMQKFGTLVRGLGEGFLTPELLAATRPDSFGKIVPLVRRSSSRLARDQQIYHRPHVRQLELMGITPHSDADTSGAMMLQLLRKDLFTGIGGKVHEVPSNADLRKLMRAFVDGEPGVFYDDLLMKHKMRNATEADVTLYRELIDILEKNVDDRQLDIMRDMLGAMDDRRRVHRTLVGNRLRKNGVKEQDIEDLLSKRFGDDLESYFPILRDSIRAVENNDVRRTLKLGDVRTMYTDEIKALDSFFGLDMIDETLGEEIQALSTFIQKNGRDAAGFSFKDPKGLALDAKVYDRADQAVADLFDIAKANPDTLAATVRVLREMKPVDPMKSRSVIASISVIPDHVRVRFYKRRMLSTIPQRQPSLIRGFGAYMNTVHKAIHFDDVLEKFVDISRSLEKVDPHEADMLNRFVLDVTGNPNRASTPGVEEASRIVQSMYLATLWANPSPTISNYLGQTLFVSAEAGIRRTAIAFRALFEDKVGGRKNILVDLMDAMGVGLEAVPKGELPNGYTSAERLAEYSKATTWTEAARRRKQTLIDGLDIFAASEGRVRKLAWLAGALKHLEETTLADGKAIWKPGMSEKDMTARVAEYLKNSDNKNALLDSADDMIAKGAFLFGNVNQPQHLRAIRNQFPGIGGAVLMFTNYPVQAISRLGMWTHDIYKWKTNPKAAREAWLAMSRFFLMGTAVAGPFFMLPVLRTVASEGDEGLAGDLKHLFVAWEKNYSLAGLAGKGIEALTGEYETIALAEKVSIFPTATAPAGPLGELFGGPAVQLVKAGAKAFGPGQGDLINSPTRIKAREEIFGGFVEDLISGMGTPGKPMPSGGISTLYPGGVAIARAINSLVTTGILTGEEPTQIDRFGRLVRPTSLSREIIRQFGRPLGEVLDAAEGRLAEAEAEERNFTVERLKKFVIEGKMASVGDILLQDPTLVSSIQPDDMKRAMQSKELVPQARAMLHSESGHMRRTFRRAIRRMEQGGLTPAEEFTVKQLIAVGVMRLRKERSGQE